MNRAHALGVIAYTAHVMAQRPLEWIEREDFEAARRALSGAACIVGAAAFPRMMQETFRIGRIRYVSMKGVMSIDFDGIYTKIVRPADIERVLGA